MASYKQLSLIQVKHVVKHEVVKKTEYNELVKKINAIYTTDTNNLTTCSNHVTYAFQSESTLYSCLNVKKPLVRSRRRIWSLSDSNVIWTPNHLVCKQALNHLAKLAKWLSCVVITHLSGAFDCVWLSCYVRVSEWIHTL